MNLRIIIKSLTIFEMPNQHINVKPWIMITVIKTTILSWCISIRKAMRAKDTPSYFYKDQCECKKEKSFVHNMHSTNIKGHQKMRVPKVEKSKCDTDNDNDSCSYSDIIEYTNMFYCSLFISK